MSNEKGSGGLGNILGGLAALLTAVVALLTFMRSNPSTQPSPSPHPSQSHQSSPPPSPIVQSPSSSPSPAVNETKIRQDVEEQVRQEFNLALGSTMMNLLEKIEQAKQSQQGGNALYGVIKLSWIDLPQVAIVLMNGSYGMMRASYPGKTGVEIVDLDLKVQNYQGRWYLVSSRPRYAGTRTPVQDYAPDVLQIQQNPVTGLYQITAACDARLVCSRIQTASIY